ncbi:hypothetical protein K2173_016503 [Erythroxylum novogranatense]|uniref:Non-specific lipid-transfer protein n=1 Tax=Erythroxylum novogranatense TaxID=1862640 RepID=A0AAV8SH32_9ROSI|nr:hypothetical protein K2173_016503 [Erythroxylum novogranatense]
MATSAEVKFVFVVVLAVVGHNVNATTEITCERVTMLLSPCISYGVMGGVVAPGCCEGLKALDDAEKSTEDRQAACTCVKNGASMIPGLDYDRVNELPGLCGTTCPYRVTPDLDCSKQIVKV